MATITKSLTIESQGTYNLTFDLWSYSEWAASAGITTSYASLAALIADEKAVRQLMTVHASVDYLANCPDSSTISTIINNNLCAKWINISDYAYDKLSAKSNIKSVMDTADKYGYGEWGKINSTTWGPLGNVPIMTSASAPYGTVTKSAEDSSYQAWMAFNNNNSNCWSTGASVTTGWVQFAFVSPVIVKRISYDPYFYECGVANFAVKASNDNVTFVSLYEGTSRQVTSHTNLVVDINNDTPYLYYRFEVLSTYSNSVRLTSLQFYGRELKPLVPTMTSNTTPKGEVIVSHEGSETNGKSYMTFDGNLTNGWYLFTNDSAYVNREEYVGYIGDDAFKVTHAFIRLNTINGAGNFRYKIQKNDNNTWNDKTNWISVTSKKKALMLLYHSIHHQMVGHTVCSAIGWLRGHGCTT